MRRFSQRNNLVTLSDINITPLLDLAFVLLIIFVITTPMLEQGLNLRLPEGGAEDSKKLNPADLRTVEIAQNGLYMFRGKALPADTIAKTLRAEQQRNPNIIVAIRADQSGRYGYVAHFLDRLERAGVVNISLRTDPSPAR
jgi:biopolymer transport protein ExbD